MGDPDELPYREQMRRRHFTAMLKGGVFAVTIGVLSPALEFGTPSTGAGAWLICTGILASVIGSAGLSVTAETRNARERYATLAAATIAAVSVVILTTSVAVLIFFDTVLDAAGATGSLPATDLVAVLAWFALWIAIPAAGIPAFMTWRRRRLSTFVDDEPVRARYRSRDPRRMH